ncbi:MAG: crotonase/enoyl-CoA hydratase family protein [Burkholderiales bacterium]
MTDLVHVDIRDSVATLTLDDGKANAFSLAMSRAIDAALDQVAKDARAVVIRGRPGVLCGGFDLKVIRGDDEAARTAMRESGMRLIRRLFMLPQPLLFACTGHSVAAGGLLLLTGDLRIGVEGEFRIGLNEVAIGLPLPQMGLELVRERLTPSAATEASLLARLYSPRDAAVVGYLDYVARSEDFDRTVADKARELAKLDPSAFAETKRRLRQATADRMQ